MKSKTRDNIDFLDALKENTSKIIKVGMEITNKTTEKIENSKITGIEKTKKIQLKSPSIIKGIGQKSLSGIEKFFGSIRRGTQYGKTSIEMLEQFAKMKELGIITDDEFETKKKEIFDRI